MNRNKYCQMCGEPLTICKCEKMSPLCNDTESSDIPRHRKKAQPKGLKRSNHKHIYEPCLLEYDWAPNPSTSKSEGTIVVFRSYCTLCGKLGDVDVSRWFVPPEKNYIWPKGYTEAAKKELDPATRTIPLFKVENGIFTKFVEL